MRSRKAIAVLVAPQQDFMLEPCREDKALLQVGYHGDQVVSQNRGYLKPFLWSHLTKKGQGLGEM